MCCDTASPSRAVVAAAKCQTVSRVPLIFIHPCYHPACCHSASATCPCTWHTTCRGGRLLPSAQSPHTDTQTHVYTHTYKYTHTYTHNRDGFTVVSNFCQVSTFRVGLASLPSLTHRCCRVAPGKCRFMDVDSLHHPAPPPYTTTLHHFAATICKTDQ